MNEHDETKWNEVELGPKGAEGESIHDVFEALLLSYERTIDGEYGITCRRRWEKETLKPWRERFGKAVER